jgi:hypothetical protein
MTAKGRNETKRPAGIGRKMAARLLAVAIGATVAAGALTPMVYGQVEVKATGRVAPQSESAFAAELLRLNQINLIKTTAAQAQAKALTGRGDVASLWRAQEIRTFWADLTKTRSELRKATDDYVKGSNAYIDSLGALTVTLPKGGSMKEIPDGFWASDQVNFIFSDCATLVVSRMEYNGASERDRDELLPVAKLGLRMCDVADDGLLAIIEVEGDKKDFDGSPEGPWQRATDARALPQYYRNFGKYYLALATDPEKNPAARRTLLNEAVAALSTDWIDAEDAADKLVKNQALLLRGKCYSELGKYKEALADFKEAQDAKNAAPDPRTSERKVMPETIFQAQYQSVVARVRNKDFDGALRAVQALRTNSPLKPSKPEEVQAAQLTMDMLQFRVAWMEAETKTDAEKQKARLAALKPISDTVTKVPDSMRAWVYEALIAQVSSKDEAEALGAGESTNVLPLQALAMSWSRFQQGKSAVGDKKSSLLGEARRLADAVRTSKSATVTEKLEATWVAAATAMDNGDAPEAARMCVEYAEMAPRDDKRIKDMAEMAVYQLGEVKKKSNGVLPADLQPVASRAVDVLGGKLGDVKWEFARGVALVKQYQTGHDLAMLKKADESFARVPKDDPNYLEARFQSLKANGMNLAMMQGKPAEAKAAAALLLESCKKFREALKDPPAGLPKEAIERAKERLPDVTFWEIAVSLDPLQEADRALALMASIETELGDHITSEQQSSMLQYRIKAYTIKNQGEKAIETVNDYANKYPQQATAIIQGLVFKWQDEIDVAQRAGMKERSRQLAQQLVELLDQLIKTAQAKPAADPKAEEERKAKVYKYKQFEAQVMVNGAQYDKALELLATLDKEKRGDAFNDLWTAHAIYGKGKFEDAQAKYKDLIEKLKAQSPPWWECYLKMIQANDELMKDPNDTLKEQRQTQNKKILTDLKAVYGQDKLGGEEHHEEYMALLKKYGLETVSTPPPN